MSDEPTLDRLLRFFPAGDSIGMTTPFW